METFVSLSSLDIQCWEQQQLGILTEKKQHKYFNHFQKQQQKKEDSFDMKGFSQLTFTQNNVYYTMGATTGGSFC